MSVNRETRLVLSFRHSREKGNDEVTKQVYYTVTGMKLDFAYFAVNKRVNRKVRKGRKEKTSVFYLLPL